MSLVVVALGPKSDSISLKNPSVAATRRDQRRRVNPPPPETNTYRSASPAYSAVTRSRSANNPLSLSTSLDRLKVTVIALIAAPWPLAASLFASGSAAGGSGLAAGSPSDPFPSRAVGAGVSTGESAPRSTRCCAPHRRGRILRTLASSRRSRQALWIPDHPLRFRP